MSGEISRRKALGIAGAGALLGGAKLLHGAGADVAGALGDAALVSDRTGGPASTRIWRGEGVEFAPGQELPRQLPPVGDMVSAFDFEEGARRTLPTEVFSAIAGGDRESFNRMSFRPRLNVSAVEMDLTTPLLGEALFTPIIVGPFADHGAYHRDAELGTLRGANSRLAPVVLSRHSTLPFEAVIAEAEVPVWFSVYADDPQGSAAARDAAASGARAIFLTVRASYSPGGGMRRPGTPIDWEGVETFARELGRTPLVLKGIESPEEAERAIASGAAGVVLSTHGDPTAPSPMDRLPEVVAAIGGRAPVLVDGSVRRGTDVLKAVILGARAVLLGRPIAWGLATYGADGVAAVLRLMQNEMARSMAMLGTPKIADLTPAHVRIHARATS